MNKFVVIALIGLVSLSNGKKLSEEAAQDTQELTQTDVAPEEYVPSVVDLIKANYEGFGHHMKTFEEYDGER